MRFESVKLTDLAKMFILGQPFFRLILRKLLQSGIGEALQNFLILEKNAQKMTATLPMFPLPNVIFPGERLAIHIYEERYKELIQDCETNHITFGSPVYIDHLQEYGTEMELTRIVRTYPSGAKDVHCTGRRVFRLKDFYPEQRGRHYPGGEVEFLDTSDRIDHEQKRQLIACIAEFYLHLEIPAPKIDYEKFNSFSLAHKLGLSIQQEYNMLKLVSEEERQAFLINHLCITIPIIQELNRTKQTIELNGHFRNYDPLDFEEFRVNS